MAKEELLTKYQQSLESTKKEIEGLAKKIDVIADIWQYVRLFPPVGAQVKHGHLLTLTSS